MVQRVISAERLESDWKSVREFVTSPDDAVIVAENGEPRFAIVSFDRYQQVFEREREARFAEARRKWDALAASIGDRNSDLTPEEIEELGNRFVNEPDDEEVGSTESLSGDDAPSRP
jgi:PHD/YefM family antitoxin component YafN of YafNO toxin-antitoxin module